MTTPPRRTKCIDGEPWANVWICWKKAIHDRIIDSKHLNSSVNFSGLLPSRGKERVGLDQRGLTSHYWFPPSLHGAPRQTSLIGNTWGLRILLNTKFKAATNDIPVFLVSEAGWSTGQLWRSPNSRHSFASLVSFTILHFPHLNVFYWIDITSLSF